MDIPEEGALHNPHGLVAPAKLFLHRKNRDAHVHSVHVAEHECHEDQSYDRIPSAPSGLLHCDCFFRRSSDGFDGAKRDVRARDRLLQTPAHRHHLSQRCWQHLNERHSLHPIHCCCPHLSHRCCQCLS